MGTTQEPKLCPVCGHEVHASHPRYVYCCKACALKGQLERERAKRQDPAVRARQNALELARRHAAKAIGQGRDKPLNAPRLCPGGPWNHGKCGHKAAYESRWCAKCQAARREYYGLEWSPNDPAQGFRGGEVEHEVAI